MEELATAAPPPPPPRRHRHRRKASDAAAAALAAQAASFGDVFGGPPRFAPPQFAAGAAPADYAEVFGGVAASCSIPYLDLPPAVGDGDGAGAGGYGEIFGRFDFGDFAAPYEDMLPGPECLAEEMASPSGSSRSSIRKESGQLDTEPSILYQQYPDAGCDQHFDEAQFYPVSFPPNNEQKFSMSYNKITRGRPDDLVEMTTCIVEPSISYVVDSCNLSNDLVDSSILSNDSEMDHVPVMDSGTHANDVKGKMSPPDAAGSSLKSANSASVVDQQQHIPISENICEDENYNNRSSTQSVSSEDAPSPDYPFLRLSNISLPAAPIKVQPPPMPPFKLLNKKGSIENGDSDVNPNSAAAAAAMREAMEFAEARLKAAKELMEKKGDSFKFRKRPAHHRSTKSTEIKENKTSEEVHLFEDKLNMRNLAKEENQNKDVGLLDKNRGGSAAMSVHCGHDKKGISPGKPQEMIQNQNGSTLEQLGKWTSDAEFYELVSHDQRCRPNAAACEGNNGLMTNSFTKLDPEKEKAGNFAGEPKRVRKLWHSNDITGLRMEHVNQVKDGLASVETEQKAPRSPEFPFCEERAIYQEPADSHLEQCPGAVNSLGHDNDGRFDILCMNSTPAEAHADLEMSCPFSEPYLSRGHANGSKNHSDGTAEEIPLVGNSNQDNNNKEGLELPCTDELPCSSARTQILQEHPNVPSTDEIKEIQVKISKLEESAGLYEIFEKEKLFSSVDETCLQNEKGRAREVTSESLVHEEMTTFGIEQKADAHEYFQDGDVDQAPESPEEEGYVTSGSAIANEGENEEAEARHLFVGDGKLMESNVSICGTLDKDPYQFRESHGSWGPQDLEKRMDRVEDIVSHGEEKEAKESLLENVEKTLVEEVLNHDSKEGQKSMETGVHKRPYDVYAEVNVRSDRDGNPFNSDDGSDDAMKMSTRTNNLQASFSGACTSMQYLSQNAESASAEKDDESTPVLENLEVDCREADREIPTEKFTALEEGHNTGSKMEERDSKDSISNVWFKDQESFDLDSNIIPKVAEETVLKSREENLDVQRTKGRNDVKETEGEIEEVLVRLHEEKEKECNMEKEKEQNKERRRRDLEEEKEREMERAKDRLAVQNATREAHERAFAEVRAKAERIALERITSARQRASVEAHEKEEKTTAQASAEKASREARMKAERAAVERATAEARERAIEKAKAAADAKERMERFRSSFKDSFKATNQDNQQETQFQKTAFNNHGKSTDIEVVEVESALRHKAKLERHQRTAERAAKALAEKNMRDMLAQREQAEKHRLAEFLDPEVKRWSNGKEGNLRALLSTLQYILGSDSGWQSVPLTDLITAAGVKKAYRKATLCVHPDKVQQRGATIRQKYICEKVFDLLKEAWNKFNSEER